MRSIRLKRGEEMAAFWLRFFLWLDFFLIRTPAAEAFDVSSLFTNFGGSSISNLLWEGYLFIHFIVGGNVSTPIQNGTGKRQICRHSYEKDVLAQTPYLQQDASCS